MTFESRVEQSGGRLKSPPAPEMIKSANLLEIENAPYLYPGISLGDIAHVIMLAEEKIIPELAARTLLSALLTLHEKMPDEIPMDPAWGDSYAFREHLLDEMIPSEAGWLRAGRARREVTNIGYRVTNRKLLLELVVGLTRTVESLTDLAGEHVNSIMPDYTYLQQAQPTSLGHYLLGFAFPLLRDLARVKSLYHRFNRCPGGIGSVNGSRLPVNRQRLSELLGFEGPILHTRDAMWQADMPLELTYVGVSALIALDRLAEDLFTWCTAEFGILELADSFSRQSVIMPNKKNPYSLAFIRGAARVAVGDLAAMANVSLSPSGQPDNRIFAYGDVPRALERAIRSSHLLAGVLETAEFNTHRLAELAESGYCQATDLAEVIMKERGISSKQAHKIVGGVVSSALQEGIPAIKLTPDFIDRIAEKVIGHKIELDSELLRSSLVPSEIVATRTTLGGANPASVRQMIAECREHKDAMQIWQLKTDRNRLVAENELLYLARRIVENGLEG